MAVALAVSSCGSAPADDNDINNDTIDDGTNYSQVEDPDAQDTVVPPVDQGVGGGVPVDNLDDYESDDDVTGDGSPD